jgi:N-acylneuraminate cytidylyltransferase/CMP-N,N'-diacetyllegionaminic acid synthase
VKKKILCLIPARAGSKGIKNKNLVRLKRKPLLYWTIKLAKRIKYFDKIIVSTDSNKIQKYALKQGVDCPFLRPKIISGSRTPMLEVFNHTLQYLSDRNYNPYAVVLLQPTSPMRTAVTINKACKMFLKKKLDSLFSVEKIKHTYHPSFVFKNKFDLVKNKLKNIQKKKYRQNIDDLYALDGGVVFITKVKRNFKHLIGGKLGFIIVKKPESYDIDSIEDLKLCEKTKINFS